MLNTLQRKKIHKNPPLKNNKFAVARLSMDTTVVYPFYSKGGPNNFFEIELTNNPQITLTLIRQVCHNAKVVSKIR